MIASRSKGIRFMTSRVPGFHGLFSQQANKPSGPQRSHKVIDSIFSQGEGDVVEHAIAERQVNLTAWLVLVEGQEMGPVRTVQLAGRSRSTWPTCRRR